MENIKAIAGKRQLFFQSIKNLDWNRTIFLDETWITNAKRVNALTKSSNNLKTIRDHEKIAVCHAGGVNGWIQSPPLLVRSGESNSTRGLMNSNKFENWFTDSLLPVVPQGYTIIMDNASYHSRLINKDDLPNAKSRKINIIRWLERNNIIFNEHTSKNKLLDVVKENKDNPLLRYKLDNFAMKKGYRIIRLPPYHSNFNPIELIWKCLKKYINERCESNDSLEIYEVILAGIKAIDETRWSNYVNITKRIVNKAAVLN